jgi:hypothetical protein
MKKLISFLLLIVILTSCDYILKKQDKEVIDVKNTPELGIAIAKDKNGCFTEAGYKWSVIRDSCIRVVDEGFRLNPTNDLENLEPAKSAYVLFNDDKLKAEVFLQDSLNSIYFIRKKDTDDFVEKSYKLSLKSGYALALNDSIIYRAAETAIKPVVGSDVSDQ